MEPRYEIIIYWSEEDNAYLAEVPELTGCIADGSCYQEALKRDIFSPTETCSSYRAWHDKASGKNFFKPICRYSAGTFPIA